MMPPPYTGPPRTARWRNLEAKAQARGERRSIIIFIGCALVVLLVGGGGFLLLVSSVEARREAAEPCRRYEHGTVDTKTPEGEPARVERSWCVEWKDGGTR